MDTLITHVLFQGDRALLDTGFGSVGCLPPPEEVDPFHEPTLCI